MTIDKTYLKGMLEAFANASEPTTNITELEKEGFKYTESIFLFHLQILSDQGLIKSKIGSSLGFTRGGKGDIMWSVVPLRLTSNGHDFLDGLRNSLVWESVKNEFKDASLGTLVKVSKELLEGYTKKKITSLIDTF